MFLPPQVTGITLLAPATCILGNPEGLQVFVSVAVSLYPTTVGAVSLVLSQSAQ